MNALVVRAAGGTRVARRGAGAMMLLLAVALGAAVGALSCVASMGAGVGHAAHAAPAESRSVTAAGVHAGHAEDVDVDHAAAADHGPTSRADVEGHPGMACVAPVDRAVVSIAPVGVIGDSATTPTSLLVRCGTGPEPPPPRFS